MRRERAGRPSRSKIVSIGGGGGGGGGIESIWWGGGTFADRWSHVVIIPEAQAGLAVQAGHTFRVVANGSGNTWNSNVDATPRHPTSLLAAANLGGEVTSFPFRFEAIGAGAANTGYHRTSLLGASVIDLADGEKQVDAEYTVNTARSAGSDAWPPLGDFICSGAGVSGNSGWKNFDGSGGQSGIAPTAGDNGTGIGAFAYSYTATSKPPWSWETSLAP